jgi:hypothetical protein
VKDEQRMALWLTEAARTEDGNKRARALCRAAVIADGSLQRPSDAVRHLRAAWVACPGDSETLDMLSRLLSPAPSQRVDGDVRAMIELYVQATQTASDPGRRVAYLERIALLWEELIGDPQRAARAYEDILNIEPGRRGAVLGLARTAARTGDERALARAILDEARLADDGVDVQALKVRAATALARHDSTRALAIETALDDGANGSAGALDRRLGAGDGSHAAALRRSTQALARTRWNSGEAGVHADYAAVVFDYNTYKLRPQNAARFVRGTKIRCRDGYVVTDAWGRTSVAGIWACGNAIFPLSGILQALYSGFVAGLSCRAATELAAHDEANGFLPWLAVPNSAWTGWLRSARELAH